MILVHRLKGQRMFLNADLVESIEETPDTVVTLVDGRRLVVGDSADELASRIVEFRASILVSATEMREGASATVLPLNADSDV